MIRNFSPFEISRLNVVTRDDKQYGISGLAAVGMMVWMMATSLAEAQEGMNASDASSFVRTVYFENDGSLLKPNERQDRHYTNGVKLTMTHQPQWAAQLGPQLPFSPAQPGEDLKTAAGYAIGQNIYTPDHIETSSLIRDDRPFAGWLYAGVYLQRATEQIFDHFEIDVGVIGPSSLAEDVQREVHEAFDQIIPGGWDNQLGDEIGINFTVQRKWRIPLLTSHGAKAVELIPQTGFTLGTVHRHVNAGFLLRIGMNLPDDFGPGRIEEPAAATGRPHKRSGGYFFVRAGGRWVVHNTLLEGNNYRSSHGVDPESLFGEVQIGVVLLFGRCEVGYSQTFQSREFKGQQDKDSFGGFTVSWRRSF